MSDLLDPRTVGVGLSLLALIPIAVYSVAQGVAGAYMTISVVSVLLIVASLYLMFGPAEKAESSASDPTDRDPANV